MSDNGTKSKLKGWRGVSEALMNTLSTRTQLIRQLMDPRRDMDSECGYITDPQPDDFHNMYEREGVARRVVGIWPEECWQVEPEVWETEEPEDTAFEKAWKKLANNFHLYSEMSEADVMSGIGRFGIILLGLSGKEPLSVPVTGSGKRELVYTRVLDDSVVKVSSHDVNIQSPRFGQPETYEVQFKEGEYSVNSQIVHWTRCIHVVDNRRKSLVYGESRMRPVFNRLQDLRKLLGGSAEMFWQGAFPGLSFEVDPRFLEFGAVELDNESLKEEMQNYANGLQRWLSTTGVSVKSLSPQVVDPTAQVEVQLRAIALSLGIPFRVFMGTEEAKLAASQDSKTWSKRVNKRQRQYLTPHLVFPLIQRLIAVGVLPKPQHEIHVDWPDMLTPSDKEKSDVAVTRTTAMKNFVQGDVEQLMSRRHWLIDIMGFSPQHADLILRSAEEEMDETEGEEGTGEEESNRPPGRPEGRVLPKPESEF